MKRADLERAAEAEETLSYAEKDLEHFRNAKRLVISTKTEEVELQEADGSLLETEILRAIRAALVQYFEGRIAEAKRELEKLGVTL